MKFLASILTLFGVLIPIMVILMMATSLWTDMMRVGAQGTGAVPAWVLIISSVSRGIVDLAISPLCFFAAHMLRRGQS